ncbi:Asp23/Gls24 family envelope stress response protein [Arthrobacter cheniae]|uniref:Asp23/Gls24 family envelope stress response protein n=1 Tax=Arthrobacter cheniae TaxID=1258888 RepID=A0A3A5M271_9MICC|nr:Asp23/Gls24 family envelope stress response protein [Arthrobacter cheniae]RJT74880.1 Asp23/Gls24 family envelope stress response protein [Arthrobacter cheniae]
MTSPPQLPPQPPHQITPQSSLHPPLSADAVDAADRGRLTISEKAIEKIAGQVALETPGVHGTAGGFLGIGAHDDEDTRPRVKVELHGLTASIHVRAGIRYPAPLRATTERLSEQIRTQVSARCGIDVRQVDIDVDALVSDTKTGDTNTNGRRELL